MKRTILTILAVLVVGITSFLGGGMFFSKRLLDDHNGMASGNFSIALASFRDDYGSKRIRIFGEVEEESTFRIHDYDFIVLPTVRDRTPDSFNPEHTNMASHLNGMVVMLACTWIMNEDPRGEALLLKLKQFIPSFKLSAPEIEAVSIADLKHGSAMMKSEAEQWSWRIGDLPQKTEAQQAGTGQPATRSQSKSEGSDKPQPESEGRTR
ncbi:MAG: hypothetical protein J0M04_00145 [Verrucomicrobia bacterium]|nr:hypothetical protein [Verrucomicrobiota bacterium]